MYDKSSYLIALFNTDIGRLFSLHNVIAVRSITFSSLSITVLYDKSSYLIALLLISGSVSYTPSTFVPLIIISAFISIALKAAAVSVVKYGLPVPPANITILPFSKCLVALLRI